MRSPTLIPELDPYLLAILVSYCLCSFSLASWLHARWLSATQFDFYAVYAAVLALTVSAGFLLLGGAWVGTASAFGLILAWPLGAALGLLAERLDRGIVRRLARGEGAQRSRPRVVDAQSRTRIVSQVSPLTRATSRGLRTAKSHRLAPENLKPSLSLMLIIAALEELIFRGLLLGLATLSPNLWIYGACVLGTLAVFACSHIQFGWPHVFGKAPLGALCLLATLISGNVLTAVVAHVFFNLRAFWALRSQPVISATPDARHVLL